jgi:hypothetical protein
MNGEMTQDRKPLIRAADPVVRWSDLGAGAKAFRAAHLVWGVAGLASLGYIWLSALRRRRDRVLAASVAFLAIEGVALVIGRGNCPFGPFQRRLGDPVPMFELVLPPRAAKAAIPGLVVVTLAGFAALLIRRPHRDPERDIGPAGPARSSRLSYRREIEIAASPEAVFDLCADLRNELEWNPDARSIVKLDDLPLGEGTQFQARWAGAPETRVRIVRYERPRTWTTESAALGLTIRTTGTLEPAGERTRYTVVLELRARGAPRLIAPFVLRSMRRREGMNLRRIKEAVERGGRPAGPVHAERDEPD